jgi:hypothetical protein
MQQHGDVDAVPDYPSGPYLHEKCCRAAYAGVFCCKHFLPEVVGIRFRQEIENFLQIFSGRQIVGIEDYGWKESNGRDLRAGICCVRVNVVVLLALVKTIWLLLHHRHAF